MTRSIEFTEIQPGMRIRATQERVIVPAEPLIVEERRVFEGAVERAYAIDQQQPARVAISFRETRFDAALMADTGELHMDLGSRTHRWSFEVLPYDKDTIVRAVVLTPEDEAAREGRADDEADLDPREFEPFMFVRSDFGWTPVGDRPSRGVRYGAMLDSDIEERRQRFDIIEVCWAPAVAR